MKKFVRVGVDLAKNYFQVHALESEGALRDWIVGLLAKKPARLVTVALANKLARILWAMMKTGECFRTEMFAKA